MAEWLAYLKMRKRRRLAIQNFFRHCPTKGRSAGLNHVIKTIKKGA
jgi:hypothetical protein